MRKKEREREEGRKICGKGRTSTQNPPRNLEHIKKEEKRGDFYRENEDQADRKNEARFGSVDKREILRLERNAKTLLETKLLIPRTLLSYREDERGGARANKGRHSR